MEIILSARDFDADEAEASGTIIKVLDPDEIDESIDKPMDEALKAEAYWFYQATSKTPAIKRFMIADEKGMEHQPNSNDRVMKV